MSNQPKQSKPRPVSRNTRMEIEVKTGPDPVLSEIWGELGASQSHRRAFEKVLNTLPIDLKEQYLKGEIAKLKDFIKDMRVTL